MNLKPYPEYKDSGIEWIGDIPKNWEINKINHLGLFKNGNGFPEALQGKEIGDVPFLKVSDINNPSLIFVNSSNNYVDLQIISEHKWNLIPVNSIIFPKIGEAINKNHRKINSQEVIIDNNLSALVLSDKFFYKYIFYIFRELNMNDFLNISAVPSINMDLLKYHKFPITLNFQEQRSIVSFLDNKTIEINKTIQKDTKLIELLKEKRIALINHVVTKGLDHDAKMKDSGVEWIGEIPERWELRKLKIFSNIVLGKMLSPSNKGNDKLKPYLRAQNIRWEYVDIRNIKKCGFQKMNLRHINFKVMICLFLKAGKLVELQFGRMN